MMMMMREEMETAMTMHGNQIGHGKVDGKQQGKNGKVNGHTCLLDGKLKCKKGHQKDGTVRSPGMRKCKKGLQEDAIGMNP